MFQIEQSWEWLPGIDFIRKLYDRPSLRRYVMIEIPINVRLYHVDVMLQSECGQHNMWDRFLCSDLATVASFFDQNKFASATVAVQTQRTVAGPYEFFRVSQILLRNDASGRSAYFCICENGLVFADHEQNPEDFRESRIVWNEISES